MTPFVTEELWAELAPASGRNTPLITAPWPEVELPATFETSYECQWLGRRLITEIRTKRMEMNVPTGAKTDLLVKGNDDAVGSPSCAAR